MNYNYNTWPAGSNTLSGTFGGILLVIFNISFGDIVRAAILAAVGAVVSFGISYALNLLTRRMGRAEMKRGDKG